MELPQVMVLEANVARLHPREEVARCEAGRLVIADDHEVHDRIRSNEPAPGDRRPVVVQLFERIVTSNADCVRAGRDPGVSTSGHGIDMSAEESGGGIQTESAAEKRDPIVDAGHTDKSRELVQVVLHEHCLLSHGARGVDHPHNVDRKGNRVAGGA